MKFSICPGLSAEQVCGFLLADLRPSARRELREHGPYTLVKFRGHGVVRSRVARKALAHIAGEPEPIVAVGPRFTPAAREALAGRRATLVTGGAGDGADASITRVRRQYHGAGRDTVLGRDGTRGH